MTNDEWVDYEGCFLCELCELLCGLCVKKVWKVLSLEVFEFESFKKKCYTEAGIVGAWSRLFLIKTKVKKRNKGTKPPKSPIQTDRREYLEPPKSLFYYVKFSGCRCSAVSIEVPPLAGNGHKAMFLKA